VERPRVLIAPDKFRGTATARELVEAVIDRAGDEFEVDGQPLSDGGEGFLDAFTGVPFTVEARNPGGLYRLAPGIVVEDDTGVTGILSVATIVGRDVWQPTSSSEALRASSAGVADAILAVAALGVDRIVLGAGGSATTDGGRGAFDVLAAAGGLPLPVTVATDVRARFHSARDYASQKGVATSDLPHVDGVLADAAAVYRRVRNVDVTDVDRGGAAGGIPGALWALGAQLEAGFDVVAVQTQLRQRAQRANVIVTGEGRCDWGSLDGKVVGALASLTSGPLLVVCGSVDPDTTRRLTEQRRDVDVVSLEDRVGPAESRLRAVELFADVVVERLRDGRFFVTDL